MDFTYVEALIRCGWSIRRVDAKETILFKPDTNVEFLYFGKSECFFRASLDQGAVVHRYVPRCGNEIQDICSFQRQFIKEHALMKKRMEYAPKMS